MISIIVPVYNAEKYLVQCLDSILDQSYKEIEVILIDDGSIDSSSMICDGYAKKDRRIKVVHKQNNGVSEARNDGIECSTGEFLTFIDADDFISSSFMEEAINAALEHNADIVQGDTVYVNYDIQWHKEGNEVLQYDLSKQKEEIIKIEDISLIKKKVLGNGREKGNPLNGVFTSGPVCKLIRSSVVKGHRFPKNLKIGEDTVFNLMVLDETERFIYMKSNWYYYRLNAASATQQYNPNIIENSSILMNTLMEVEAINKPEYNAYIQERAIQQLTGIMTSYILNDNNHATKIVKKRQIAKLLSSGPWEKIFNFKKTQKLPGNLFDKGMLIFCKLKTPGLIMIWATIRKRLLTLRSKFETNK